MNRQRNAPTCDDCNSDMYVYQYAIQPNGAKRPKRATCDQCGRDQELDTRETPVATDGGEDR